MTVYSLPLALHWLCSGLHKHGADGKGDPKEKAKQSACTFGLAGVFICPFGESSRHINPPNGKSGLEEEKC